MLIGEEDLVEINERFDEIGGKEGRDKGSKTARRCSQRLVSAACENTTCPRKNMTLKHAPKMREKGRFGLIIPMMIRNNN